MHERDLAVAIINQLNLSADTVQKIRESMQQTGISFTDAAIALGLMTTEQLHDIIVAQQRSERDNVSMVESAMRKMSLRRSFVATEPQGHAAASKRLIIAHDAYSPRSEKIRGLRTELQLRFGTTTQGTIFAIVSAGPSEGRSQLAAELAIAFAQLDRRTLLVDMDFRSPQQHLLYSANNDAGLSQAISGDGDPYIFAVEGFPKLNVMTTGPLPKNPLEVLSAPTLENLIKGWRANYDYIICDTPPVTPYADALAISRLVSRVLLVTRAQHTQHADVREMLRRLTATNTEILGSVINNF